MSRALGRYELLRPLARGGMAEVFLARRRAGGLEKWLVVKRIRPERSSDVRFLDLFVREARLSMSLAHQNIVPVFDFGRIDDQVFLAMERVEGKDLGSSLARARDAGRSLPPLVAAFIAAECCQALDYAHHRKGPDGAALGIVHRDVTPRNVLLSWSGEVKLTDFGIAALAGDATSSLIGTPAYMAPEQARGEALDARADVYAVGMVLRELLAGERARAGDDRAAILEAAKTGALAPWTDAAARVPEALIAIVDRATAPRPEDRFADAREMLSALDAFIVAERAANTSEAPARLLATWLEEVWADEREDRGVDGDIGGEHLVSFLDDGALDVIGTGTQRSLAATAADEPEESAAPAPPATAPAPEPPAAEPPPPRVTPGPIGRAAPRRLALVVLGLGIAGAAIAIGIRGGRQDAPRATVPAVATLDAGVTTVVVVADAAAAPPGAPPDAAPSAVALAAVDAAPEGPAADGLDAGPAAPARPPEPRSVRPLPERAPPAAGSAAGSAQAAPAPARRNVTINATPWAYFTVDDDPTPHETVKTLELAPGPHRLRFTNPVLKIERTVTIDVPADRDLSHVERLGN